MPLIETKGAGSAQGFGQFARTGVATYIEDVFSTYLYTGNGSTQTITNGIDLSGKGGLVWIKQRSVVNNHFLAHAATVRLRSDTTNANVTTSDGVTSFNSNGFSIGANANLNGATDGSIVSWTFRKQAKFFDVVTYTGNGVAGRTVAHNLGSVPGCIIVKDVTEARDWNVYHRSLGETQNIVLSSTAAAASSTVWNNTAPTATEFTVYAGFGANKNGNTYVAYLFAHDAGGFGQSGSDNVISCGSFISSNATVSVSLGWEPQWILYMNSELGGNWSLVDTTRGMPVDSNGSVIFANTSDGEASGNVLRPTSTGFDAFSQGNNYKYIYIAIRRGPMRTPTTGTSVFSPNARTGNGSTQTVSGLSFSPDLWLTKNRGNTQNNWAFDRLRGPNQPLSSNLTDSEATNTTNWFGGTPIFTPTNTGFTTIGQSQVNTNSGNYSDWLFGRAPGFFDVVCYTGTGSARTVTHNLGVAPELMIFKERGGAGNWLCYHTGLGATKGVFLNLTNTPSTSTTFFNDTSPTNTVFTVGTSSLSNSNLATYVTYLFATCPGVSKVFSYTGNGSSQTINCGFTGGARFVLIKRTDSTGDWYVWDSARGIVAGNDPHLSLNTTAAEVTTDDSVDTDSTGFVVNQLAATNVNVNAATYIGLAIA